MRNVAFLGWLVLLIACLPAGSALAQEAVGKRVALVIGNGAYERPEYILPNPPNDAKDMAAKLRELGFEVIEAIDRDYRGMRGALRQFDRALRNAKLGLFFYAGHGMEYLGQNYLFPTDAVLESEGDVGLSLIGVDQVLRVMETRTQTRLIFLDACRDNPLARQFRRSLGASRSGRVGQGLADIKAAYGTMIAYATAAGGLAADGDGRNSPFTGAILTHLDEPGLEIRQMMGKVRDSVAEKTNQDQIPWDSTSLRGAPVILNLKADIAIEAPPAPIAPTLPAPVQPVAPPSEPVQNASGQRAEIVFWESIKDSDQPAVFEAYLARFGEEGLFGPLARIRLDNLTAKNEVAAPPPQAELPEPEPVAEAPRSEPVELAAIPAEPEPPAPDPSAIELALGLSREDWRRIQAALSALEHDPRGIDGRPGRNTRAAIGAWQRGQSHEATGYLDGGQRNNLLASAGPDRIEELLHSFRPGQKFKDCAACPEMVVIPAGSFTMGSPASEKGRGKDEGPQHRVRIAEPFAVGRFEVTFAEWDACVAAGGCGGYRPKDQGWGRGKRPVIHVSWDDAQAYVKWLRRQTGQAYRLLSEAEWEYAARAGTTTPYHFGSTISTEQANYEGRHYYGLGRKGKDRKQTVQVGMFNANAFGMHDVHGNVREWVEDRWHDSYVGAPANGSAWVRKDSSWHMWRGGSWLSNRVDLRSANRGWMADGYRNNSTGFRIAKTLH